MVEYVLKNPVEAKRVEITKPPKPFALKTFDAQQDESVAEAAPQDGAPSGAAVARRGGQRQ